MNLDIELFLHNFRYEYQFLYDNYDYVAGFDEAVAEFDERLKDESFQKFVAEFARYRGDCISSDREAAAFMFTFYDLIEEEVYEH